MFYLYICTYMPGVLGGQKKVLDPLGLELRMAVNQYVGSGK